MQKKEDMSDSFGTVLSSNTRSNSNCSWKTLLAIAIDTWNIAFAIAIPIVPKKAIAISVSIHASFSAHVFFGLYCTRYVTIYCRTHGPIHFLNSKIGHGTKIENLDA